MKHCKAPSAWEAAKPRQFEASSSRPFRRSAGLTHLESGLDGSLRPAGLGNSPGERSGVCPSEAGRGAERLPPDLLLRLLGFSSTPRSSSRPSSLLASPICRCCTRSSWRRRRAESCRPPPPDARAVRGANQEAPSSSRADGGRSSPACLTLES